MTKGRQSGDAGTTNMSVMDENGGEVANLPLRVGN